MKNLAHLTALMLMTSLLAACTPAAKKAYEQRNNNAFSSKNARQCLSTLKSNNVSFAPLPDKNYGGGCTANNSVKLINFGTPTSNLGPMTCNLANSFTNWTRKVVRPAAKKYLGSALARIETSGTYSCRRVSGSGRLSQHAKANAVDIFAFVTKDGRKITVKGGWNGDKQAQKFLRHLHRQACGPFGTVLGPNYNRQHADHFHLDMSPSRMNGSPFCR